MRTATFTKTQPAWAITQLSQFGQWIELTTYNALTFLFGILQVYDLRSNVNACYATLLSGIGLKQRAERIADPKQAIDKFDFWALLLLTTLACSLFITLLAWQSSTMTIGGIIFNCSLMTFQGLLGCYQLVKHDIQNKNGLMTYSRTQIFETLKQLTDKYQKLVNFPIKFHRFHTFAVPHWQQRIYIDDYEPFKEGFILHEIGHLVHADTITMGILALLPLLSPWLISLVVPTAALSFSLRIFCTWASATVTMSLYRACERRADRYAMQHCSEQEKIDFLLAMMDLYTTKQTLGRADFNVCTNHILPNISAPYPLFTQRILHLCAAGNLNIEDLISGTISDDETKLTGRLLRVDETEDESNNGARKKRQENIINALKTLRLSHLNYNPNRSRTMTVTEILNIRQNNNILSKLWHFCEQFADTCVDYCITINTYCLTKLRIDSALVYLSTSVMHVFYAIEKTLSYVKQRYSRAKSPTTVPKDSFDLGCNVYVQLQEKDLVVVDSEKQNSLNKGWHITKIEGRDVGSATDQGLTDEKTIVDFIRHLGKTTTEFDFGRIIQYTTRHKTEEIEYVASVLHPPAKLF